MRELTELSDINLFFGYGNYDLELETESDIIQGLMQPKRSMYYNRSDGCEIANMENYPNTLVGQVSIRYSIATFISRRNENLPTNMKRDRRVIISQNLIDIKYDDGLQINVLYIPLSNYNQINKTSYKVPNVQ